MKANIIQIGNGEGIILPPDMLHRLNLSLRSAVQVLIEDEKIVIKAEPRQGWAEAFRQYALSEEESCFPDIFEDEDLSELTWERE
jgi:antitoxin MazE